MTIVKHICRNTFIRIGDYKLFTFHQKSESEKNVFHHKLFEPLLQVQHSEQLQQHLHVIFYIREI